jgi:creatinine amidohydrolase
MKLSRSILALNMILVIATPVISQESQQEELPFHLGELTSPDFVKAVEKSGGTCIIPAGILEKHGSHLPLSSDLIQAREIASRAASMEYALVYPEYYFGQIFEAKHQPGTIAYSNDLIWRILEETCEELSRNGIKKIVIVNGHGGNNHFLAYFCQSQLASRKDYVVVLFTPDDSGIDEQIRGLRVTSEGGHADEVETSVVYAIRPDLVHAERAREQSGKDMDRLNGMPYGYTGIWWYASFPNHYAGDGSSPQKTIGEIVLENDAWQLAKLLRFLKTDHSVSDLQNRFYSGSENPLDTPQ